MWETRNAYQIIVTIRSVAIRVENAARLVLSAPRAKRAEAVITAYYQRAATGCATAANHTMDALQTASSIMVFRARMDPNAKEDIVCTTYADPLIRTAVTAIVTAENPILHVLLIADQVRQVPLLRKQMENPARARLSAAEDTVSTANADPLQHIAATATVTAENRVCHALPTVDLAQ